MFPAAIDSQFCGSPEANGGKIAPVSVGACATLPPEVAEEATVASTCEWSCPSLHDPIAAKSLSYRSRLMLGMKALPRAQAYRTSLALAEWLCRTADRIDPA
jgi:hypothetical protein